MHRPPPPATDATVRRQHLAEVVEARGVCTIAELATLLDVSEMTVRRDVARLEADGRVKAFHGGVRAAGGRTFRGTDYAVRAEVGREVKQLLAREAVRLAERCSVIGIDSGTTAAAMAGLIADDRPLRVVTTSLPVVTALSTHRTVEVTALGGVLHVESQSFLGATTVAAAGNLHLETFFLTGSAAGRRGVFCTYETAAAIKHALVDAADRVVLLTDSSKFDGAAMSRVCGWDRIDVVVTDDRLDADTRAYLDAEGIEVITVGAGETSEPIVDDGQVLHGS